MLLQSRNSSLRRYYSALELVDEHIQNVLCLFLLACKSKSGRSIDHRSSPSYYASPHKTVRNPNQTHTTDHQHYSRKVKKKRIMAFVSSSWSSSSNGRSSSYSSSMNIKKGKHRGRPSSSSRGASLFTEVLYDLLEDAGESGCKGVVSWSNDGLAFKVHNREMFMEHILPNYFLTKKYKSFARQLQLWGFAFCKKSSNPKYGACK